MSSIITAGLRHAKNFVTQFLSQRENVNPEVIEIEGEESDSGYFQRSIFSSRKRTASNLFEPEITDDEDDLGGPSAYFRAALNQGSKRVRSENFFDEMSRKYATRGSGIPPTVEGLSRQPWEFNFSYAKRNKRHEGSASQSRSGLKPSDVGNKKVDDEAVYREPVPSTSRQCDNAAGPSSSRFMSSLRGINPDEGIGKRKVEVITLDDDTPAPKIKPSTSSSSNTALPPSKREMTVFKRSLRSPMKARGSNRISFALDNIRQKFQHTYNSVRLNEMQQYRKLLQSYNVLSSSNVYTGGGTSVSALTKSKVDRTEFMYPDVIYKRGSSPTRGSITFQPRRSILPPLSDPSSALVMPRLFTTSKDLEMLSPSQTPTRSPSKMLAWTFPKEPEIVDLVDDQKESFSAEKPLSPIVDTQQEARSFPSPEKANFRNLEEALNISGALLDVAEADEPKAIEGKDKESKAEESDISILAEKIVNTSRSRKSNTLALEQTLCPYIDKKWLDDSKSSWRERQRLRDQRIHEEAETMKLLRRESTIEKDLNQRIRDKLTLTEFIVLEEPPPEMPVLTDEMLRVIEYAKRRGNDNEVLAKVQQPKGTVDVTRNDIKTLGPLQWLNDTIINTYMGLIVLRSKLDNYPSVYAFQTFFYPKLLDGGYNNALKRWTRKDDIFAHDLIIVPIHLGMHWCLACIDLRKRIIKYYDSMGGDNNKCLHTLLDYLAKEMKERKQMDLDKSQWKLVNVRGIPQQQNGSDCGMFACKFAEYLSRDADFTFTQEDMPYYRDRMIYELLRQDLLYP